MAELRAEDFREFFQKLHGNTPFPWQEALAARVCAGDWPEVIDLPTASGKTACIDIALFALAVREGGAVREGKTPRRIFFVVDRRVVVNEAYQRMCRVRKALKESLKGSQENALYEVARRFCAMARGSQTATQEDDDDPLLVSEMRGGAFRDESWVNNPLQPAVITSTVDQVGSRLLFRGYGVSPSSRPIHAGLIGNDALILLDEAHCSLAFAQTLQRVQKYRADDWASQPLKLSFQFVEMTATPSRPPDSASDVFRLSDRDHEVEVLRKRLEATKPTRLLPEVKGRKNDAEKLVEALVGQAEELAKVPGVKRIAVFANRVKTVKRVYERLREEMKETESQVELVIGSMRPVDREDLERRLGRLKSGEGRNPREEPLTFVVSTQCLEVGADLDFDVLVTECASIDALLQRFGRLDRLGEFGRAQGAVVIGSWQIDPKQPDPVYGKALAETWAWLKEIADDGGNVNMGIRSRSGEPRTVKELFANIEPENKQSYCMPTTNAAILLPAHVDMLAQTSPVPRPDPLIEIFLHGPQRNAPEVQVVWRGDIESTDEEAIEIVKLCPPSSREAMPVSITAFRKWFSGDPDALVQESDIEFSAEAEIPEGSRALRVISWEGENGEVIDRPSKIKPGQTLVVKTSAGGWDELGYIPPGASKDVADRAAFTVRKSLTLRLHPEVIKEWPETASRRALVNAVAKEDTDLSDIEELLRLYKTDLVEDKKQWPLAFLQDMDSLRQRQLDTYPGAKIPYVLRARRGGRKQNQGGHISLKDHLEHVERQAASMASGLEARLKGAIVRGARLHDYGKVDLRFQAWLRGGDHMAAARYSRMPIAKSGNDVLLKQELVRLPKHFRHELLSLLFAEKSADAEGAMRDLILHLVAAHHGGCRPFAPVIPDPEAECASYNGITVCKEERAENAPHRLDRGIPDRFWRLTAQYGWWGLAYLEAILRLADWRASGDGAAEVSYE